MSKSKELSTLQTALISAQSATLELQQGYSSLLAEKQELEQKVTQLEAWGKEKEDYELREMTPGAGVFAYAYAPKTETTQPFHWLCQKCYQEGKKGMLQTQHNVGAATLKCPVCRTDYHPPIRPFRQAREGR